MSVGALSGSTPDFSSLRANFEQIRAQKFEHADADKSGALSFDEFSQAHENRPNPSADSAGGLSTEELFASIDANEDGEVSSDEFAALKPEGGRPPPPPPPPPGGGGAVSYDTLSTLLGLQDVSNSETGSASELISQLIESVTDSEEEEVA